VLQVSRVHYPVTVLGVGRRLGLWVQGCALACVGCMARDTWDSGEGQAVEVARLAELWRQAVADGADGITVSGGEPLEQPSSLAALLTLVTQIRGEATAPGGLAEGRELDILVYTGHEWAELDETQRAAAGAADVLVTGRYQVGNPTTLVWRGSENQRLLPLTPLGERRYAPHVDRRTAAPAVQVDLDDEGRLRIIGVPHAGGMQRLERALRESGATVGQPSWRPPRPPDPPP
jgi:anaerobic ribonucleoside-triphosphate reductase activating protein